MGAKYKTVFSIKNRVVFLFFIALFSSLGFASISSPPAKAITKEQHSYCYYTFNSAIASGTTKLPGTNPQGYTGNSCGEVCRVNTTREGGGGGAVGVGGTPNSTYISCTPPPADNPPEGGGNNNPQPQAPAGSADTGGNLINNIKDCDDNCKQALKTAHDQCVAEYRATGNQKPQSNRGLASCIAGKTNVKNANDIREALDTGGNNSARAAAESAEEEGGATSCVVPGVGWIICPVARIMAGIVDVVFQLLKLMLQVPPISIDTQSPLYKSWATMRNFANVAFVIAFLIIVFSQVTSMGISNYGLKRMLPRLITAAILVNISYWICAIAVDISNLMGIGLYELLKGLAYENEAIPNWGEVIAALLAGASIVIAGGAITMAAAPVAAAAIGTPLLWLALPMVLMAIISIVVAVVILAFRQALIIILIVISPLAFVAYLLPNTETYFDRWRKTLTTMLVFYPIFGVLFGGSMLAATILVGASKTAGANTGGILILTAMLVQLAPLISTPYVVKMSGGMLGKIGSKMNSLAAGTGIVAASRAKSRERFELGKRNVLGGEQRKGVRGFLQRRAVKSDRRAFKRDMLKSQYEAGQEASRQEYVANDAGMTGIAQETSVQKSRAASAQRVQSAAYTTALQSDSKMLENAGGIDPSGQSRILAGAIKEEESKREEDIKNAGIRIQSANLTDDEKADLASGSTVQKEDGTSFDGGDLATRMAAAQAAINTGDTGVINKVIDHANSNLTVNNPDQQRELVNIADTLQRMSGKPSYIQPADLNNIRQNGATTISVDENGVTKESRIAMGTSTQMIQKSIHDNVYSSDRMASTGRQEMNTVANVANAMANPVDENGNMVSLDPKDSAALARLGDNAVAAKSDDILRNKIGKQSEAVDNIAKHATINVSVNNPASQGPKPGSSGPKPSSSRPPAPPPSSPRGPSSPPPSSPPSGGNRWE